MRKGDLMKRFRTFLGAGALLLASVAAAQTGTTTRQTTVETKTTQYTGEVTRYDPGKVIVVRDANGQVVTYTIGPSLTVPTEVQVGRRVTLYTEPDASGTTVVTRITTVSSTAPGDPSSPVSTTRETVVQNPSGAQTTTTTTTRVIGEVVRYEPGQTIVIRHPDSQIVTYTLSPSIQVPTEVTAGRRVTVFTQPSTSGPVVVTRITTEASGATMESTGGAQIATIYGTISAYEPGKTITVVLPDSKRVTYVIDTKSEVPTDLAVGKTVTVRTTTVTGAPQPVVRKITYKTQTTTTKEKTVQ
jgi:hypothetical protein